MKKTKSHVARYEAEVELANKVNPVPPNVAKFKCIVCHYEFPEYSMDDDYWWLCWKCGKKISLRVGFVQCPECKTRWDTNKFTFIRDGYFICPLCDYRTSHFYGGWSDPSNCEFVSKVLKKNKHTVPELEKEIKELAKTKAKIKSLINN